MSSLVVHAAGTAVGVWLATVTLWLARGLALALEDWRVYRRAYATGRRPSLWRLLYSHLLKGRTHG